MLSRLGVRTARVFARARSTVAESYTERMDKTGRPVSPSIFIYKYPAIALSSITVRVTGVLLTFGARAAQSPLPVAVGTLLLSARPQPRRQHRRHQHRCALHCLAQARWASRESHWPIRTSRLSSRRASATRPLAPPPSSPSPSH